MTIRKRIIAVVATTVVLLTMVVVPTFANSNLQASEHYSFKDYIDGITFTGYYTTRENIRRYGSYTVDTSWQVTQQGNVSLVDEGEIKTYWGGGVDAGDTDTFAFTNQFTNDYIRKYIYAGEMNSIDGPVEKWKADFINKNKPWYVSKTSFLSWLQDIELNISGNTPTGGSATTTWDIEYSILKATYEGFGPVSGNETNRTWQWTTSTVEQGTLDGIISSINNTYSQQDEFTLEVGEIICINSLSAEMTLVNGFTSDVEYMSTISLVYPTTGPTFYSWESFIEQGTAGRTTIGQTQTITNTEYVENINIKGIVQSIADALSVDILGPISPLDIIATFVAIGLTIWLLKVFAGG